jgi:hypothetical protein
MPGLTEAMQHSEGTGSGLIVVPRPMVVTHAGSLCHRRSSGTIGRWRIRRR